MDPVQSSQSIFNSSTQWAGARAEQQESASALRNTSTDSKSLEAMREENKKTDAHSAEMKKIQGEADRRTQEMNTMNAINSAQQDSLNKSISSAAQNAKGISY